MGQDSAIAPAIVAEGLGKAFDPRLRLRDPGSLLNILRPSRAVATRRGVYATRARRVHAVRDVSFALAAGTLTCLIGRRRGGRSTLLGLLAGAIPPSSGRAVLRGSVSALLSINGNLVVHLSGLENIEEDCRLKGIPRDQVAAIARSVIDFAGLGEFADVAVRRYSTGMRLRLSLALALHGEPDIVLLDDVLGVGDAAFQERSMQRLAELRSGGATAIVATADERLVRRLADRVIELSDGAVVYDGDPDRPVLNLPPASEVWIPHLGERRMANEMLEMSALAGVLEPAPDPSVLLARFTVRASVAQRLRPVVPVTGRGMTVFRSVFPRYVEVAAGQEVSFEVALPLALLGEGSYSIAINVVSVAGGETYALQVRQAMILEVAGGEAPASGPLQPGVVAPPLAWHTDTLSGGAA